MKKYLFYQKKARLSVLVLLQTVRMAGTIGVAVLINMLIDTVQAAIAAGSARPLVKCAALCGIYALILGGIIFASEKWKAAVIKHIMLRLRQGLLHGILEKNVSEYQERNSAEYITLLGQNLGTFEESFLKNLISIYDSVVGIFIAVILLLWINPVIAVISVAAMAVPSLIPKLFGTRLGVLQKESMQNTAGCNARIKDILNGFELIKAYRAEDKLERLHDESAGQMESSKVRMAGTMAFVLALANAASVAVQFLIMSLAGVFAIKGLVTIGSIIAVTQLTGQVISPAFQLSASISRLRAVKPICAQIKENLYRTAGNSRVPVLQEMERSLILRDVSFSYENREAGGREAEGVQSGSNSALADVSLQLVRGKKYVIAGRSGSGKSTLLKLLAGYYTGYSGEILLDGRPDRQAQAALIHQDPFLFDDTIRNNITLYESFPDSAVREACRLAGLGGLIDQLPDGIDTAVSENGARFSGGEKQRIAVARAILHKKNLFLLDEATSALDGETTNFVEDSILSLKDVTCVAVTHRLTAGSLKKYDQILVMDRGRIVERGSYDELSAASGLFSKLYSCGQ